MIRKEKTPQDWLKQLKRPKNVAFVFVAANLSNIVIGTYAKEYDFYTKASISFVLTIIFFIIIWSLYDRNLMGEKIEYIKNGITQLLEKEKLVCSSEEIFNFNRKTLGYFYNKIEIDQEFKNNGSAEATRKVCLVMEDKENVIKYKDYYLKIDEFSTQKKEEGFSKNLSSKIEVEQRNDCDNDTIGVAGCDNINCYNNKKEGGCKYKEGNAFVKEIKTKLLEKTSNKILNRYYFTGGLKSGYICRYKIIDCWPDKTYAITKEDLDKKNEFLKEEEEKKEKETYYFKISDPIKYLKIRLEFPSDFYETIFINKVISAEDNKYIIHGEVKRFIEKPSDNGKKVKQIVAFEIEYPIIGLRYGVEWSPLKNNIKKMSETSS